MSALLYMPAFASLCKRQPPITLPRIAGRQQLSSMTSNNNSICRLWPIEMSTYLLLLGVLLCPCLLQDAWRSRHPRRCAYTYVHPVAASHIDRV
jgi:hypothetical protein